jgi:hypothetical protein
MARRRRRNPLGAFGYPGDSYLRRQAALLAGASLPSEGSINRQYGAQLNDVRGFTQALVGLLRDAGPDAGAAYDPAIAQQRGINTAAQARLAEFGPEYANLGAATAEGPLSGLLERQAASQSYASRQPGIAARAGALQGQGVLSARQEALTARGEQFHQALPGLFYQLQQNAQGQANTNRQFSFEQAQAREQRRQFDVEQQRLRDQFAAEQSAAAARGTSRWTPTQINNFAKQANQGASSAADHGVGPQQFIREAVDNGIPRWVAQNAVMRIYPRYRKYAGEGGGKYGGFGGLFSAPSSRAMAYSQFERWVKAQGRGRKRGKRGRRTGAGGL